MNSARAPLPAPPGPGTDRRDGGSGAGADKPGRRDRARAFVAGSVLAVLIGVIAMMVTEVVQQLRELRTAASDNVQWTLSQVDAEFLRFRLALDLARLQARDGTVPDETLASLRNHFDIFYSRIDTFRGNGSYASLHRDAEFSTALAEVQTDLGHLGARIDLPDAELGAALDPLGAEAEAMAPSVRGLSLMGLAKFAQNSDRKREEMTATLARLAATTGLMLIAISLLAVLLLRLYRLSERRGVQQAKSAARVRLVLEASFDAIVASDREGRILVFNPAAERIFGFTAEEAIGHDLLAALLPGGNPDGQPALAAILRDPAPEALGRIHLEGRSRDGRTFPAEVTVRRAEGDQGQVFVLFIRDVSLLKKAEAALIEAHDRAVAGEKAKADFVAVMSHEIRTPLNGLLGNMSLLLDTPLDARQRGYVSAMEVSGRLLSSLVNDVLDMSKLEAGKMTLQRRAFRLSQVMDEIVESQMQLAAANGNALGWTRVGPPFDAVIGDPDKIRQVVLNFVNNAIKFTRDGTVAVEIEALGHDPAPGQPREVEIRVSDTGEGIAPADLGRIFSDFEMLDSSYGRRPGTGLGLGIARRLAHLMGGEIGVESEPGEGSLFWLRLPLDPDDGAGSETEPAAPASRPGAQPSPPAAPLSILIVEDNDINRAILRRMVEAEGHDATEARNGREGVDRAAQRPFDAILMDISMPVMDGRSAARAIREGDGASHTAPIVAVTAHALPEEIEAFRAAGMTEVLKKPIDREALRALLARLTARRTLPEAPAAADPLLFDADHLGPEGPGSLGPELLRLLDSFIAQTDQTVAALTDGSLGAGLDRTEADKLRLAAIHRTAGAAGTFGARAFHAQLLAIETAAKRGDTAPLEHAAAQLPALWQQTRAALMACRNARS